MLNSQSDWAAELFAATFIPEDLLCIIARCARLRRAAEYVVSRLDSHVSLQGVAHEVSMHPAAFSRFFSRRTGIQFRAFVRAVRIAAACRRLSEEDCSLRELSSALGYASVSAFVRSFKALNGCSPAAYRENALRPSASLAIPTPLRPKAFDASLAS